MKYGLWCYRFKFLEGIKLQWLFYGGSGEIRFLSDLMYNHFKFLVFGNIKKVFKRFAFQANFFFLKMKKDFNKIRYFKCQILMPEC